jgi:hypothetical protein
VILYRLDDVGLDLVWSVGQVWVEFYKSLTRL